MKGFAFATQSDTEVILNRHLACDESGFSTLNGMFAFAISDTRSAVMHVVRDHMRVKPLHYSELSGGVVFRSEKKGIAALGPMMPGLNEEAASEYLAFGDVVGECALYHGIHRLLPAHSIRIASDRVDTISIGLEAAGFDESHCARMVSKHCRTWHHELTISSKIHIHAWSQPARGHVKVVLTPEGADEPLGGYLRYLIQVWIGRWRAVLRLFRKLLLPIS